MTGGAAIADFEHALAARCKVDHAVAVANGSVALDLAVLSLGVGPGDEVITTPLTFVATANAVLASGRHRCSRTSVRIAASTRRRSRAPSPRARGR